MEYNFQVGNNSDWDKNEKRKVEFETREKATQFGIKLAEFFNKEVRMSVGDSSGTYCLPFNSLNKEDNGKE